jgi:hypothetical protein
MTPKQHPSTEAAPLIVRHMKWDDIPSILAIARETSSCWIGPDFRSVLQCNETLGFVGQQENQVVGFALCTVSRSTVHESSIHGCPIPRKPESFKGWPKWFRRIFNKSNGLTRRIHLFAVGVALDFVESEVERLLLKCIDTDLRSAADRLEAIVPETNVFAQSVLRESGFLAVRVFSGYYLHIDGYLMERDNATFLAPTASADVNAPNTS